MTTAEFTGSMRMMTPMALQALGTMYSHNTEVLEQYVENGYDAGAREVIVLLERDRVAVFDDGHGFVPKMSADDLDTLQIYRDDIGLGKLSWETPFDVLFPELSRSPSLSSFQWMMECIGLSSKRFSNEPQARGIKGIGALSFQQIANKAVWHSKPSSELALAYYGDQNIAQNPPTYMLSSATAEELRRRFLGYKIDSSDQLKHPLSGREVASGTLVALTELREGIERSLRPPQVIRSLQERFGNDIKHNRLKILVVDKMTEAGLKANGITVEVPPAEYPGTLILHKTSFLKGGKGPFDVEVYYDPVGRALHPKLMRKGSEVCPITQLADFNKDPWNIGKLSGLVAYPELPDEEAPWDAQKSLPLAGPVYNQWQHRVWGLAEDIQKKIDIIEETLKLSGLEEFSRLLGQETVEAMREIPEFADIVVQSKKPATGTKRPVKPQDRVLVAVVNENSDGVAGAQIQLLRTADNQLARDPAVTKRSGLISLGKVPYGRYRLRLAEVPAGAVVDGMDEYTFNLSGNMPGVRETFRVINNEPKRLKSGPLNQISPFFHGWSNPDEPYTQRLEYGVVEINTEGLALSDAIKRGDFVGRAVLCAQYMASAIAEFAAAEDEDPGDTLLNASRLFGSLARRIMMSKKREILNGRTTDR